MMQTSQPRKPRLRLSALFLQRFVGLLESIVASGGDGCVVVEVRKGRIRRLQLRIDQDLPPAADMFMGRAAAEDRVTGRNTTE
jgi:hypothetical protein